MVSEKELASSYSRLSVNDLYMTLGYSSYFKRPIPWTKGKPTMLHPLGVGFAEYDIISPTKARMKGRLIYKRYDSKLKMIICKKFQWCKKSKSIRKSRKHLISVLISIPAVCTLFPPSAPYLTGGATIIPIFLHAHKNIDKLCKCKKEYDE